MVVSTINVICVCLWWCPPCLLTLFVFAYGGVNHVLLTLFVFAYGGVNHVLLTLFVFVYGGVNHVY